MKVCAKTCYSSGRLKSEALLTETLQTTRFSSTAATVLHLVVVVQPEADVVGHDGDEVDDAHHGAHVFPPV